MSGPFSEERATKTAPACGQAIKKRMKQDWYLKWGGLADSKMNTKQ